MPKHGQLDEVINDILDNIVDMLKDATATDEALDGVAVVVRGDRSRPRPKTPALWVFGETAQPQPQPRTIAETWHLPVVITPIVKATDPEAGYREATKWAARARSVVLKKRDLGLRDYVQDTRSARFESSAPWHRRETLYSAVAAVLVVFTILEEF